MAKKRIYELAKELGTTSAELVKQIKAWKLLPGINVVASSGVDEDMASEITKRATGKTPASKVKVIRRRKKVAQDADTTEGLDAINDEDSDDTDEIDEDTSQEDLEVNKDKDKEKKITANQRLKKAAETATIIYTPQKSTLQDKKNMALQDGTVAKKTPDFIKVEPVEPVETVEKQEKTVKKEMETTEIKKETVEKPEVKKEADKKEVKIVEKTEKKQFATARIISRPIVSPKPEAAKVVGVKSNWKETPPTVKETPKVALKSKPRVFNKDDDDEIKNIAVSRKRKKVVVEEPLIVNAEAARSKRERRKKAPVVVRKTSEEEAAATDSRGVKRRSVGKEDLYGEGNWARGRGRRRQPKKTQAKTELTTPKAIKRRIKIDDVVTVAELAKRLSVKAGDVIKHLMALGVLANLNQSLDFDTATIIASEFGYEVEKSSFDETTFMPIKNVGLDNIEKTSRPPVVTIMGHVDHGKTSLLDYVRKASVQTGEAGGITQHIGAYNVLVGDKKITFLDTPGHEAFTSMRSRGAQVTDIVILIVAADDGVMPQTKEAADHARAAGVPIIVAVNKVDKPQADVEKIKMQMMDIGLVQEAWGGDVVFVEISAKTGQGVDELLEMILLQTEMLELVARPKGLAVGRIIEAHLDTGRGPVATVLVQEGLLKRGDAYVCGVYHGRIRALTNDQGQRVEQAGPSVPIEIQGIAGVPAAGDDFVVLEDEKQARQVSEHRLLKQRESELSKSSKLTLENLFDGLKDGSVNELNLILKTDVQGSLEAIIESVMKLSTTEMKINIIHQSTGVISENDVMLASASNALIVGFSVRPSVKVQDLADSEQVQIRYYEVIYKLLDDIKEAMAGLLAPIVTEKILGQAEVRAVFMVSKVGMIAGSYVTDGKIVRGARARLIRDGVVVHKGKLSSLKRIKDDAKEVNSGYECGIGFEHFNDVKVGDIIEAYQLEETAATVDLIDAAVERAIKNKKLEATKLKEEAQLAAEAEGEENPEE